ncbi:LON peptidase substrate-binding domain-containing protein [Streptomyces nitrosporeus]|uniref:ATP-dependent protease n=1 Tax=Streptomyces nitrosporeus TaxID=28894 RepID=A0A5J6FFN1_9ACTN|nr:LON peptidase substrate-binding domain-containing protein [Streptomyces nitrosporeus]QEU74943.1 ATP-dependent protease [Streptomyces nitrosporeus]GGY92304.1 hypothetical protein GCM10010327_23870 [Streptomyces nitrosporeus]
MTTARLPLFPLNAVLFPGLVLPLDVFEERYRAMMRELAGADADEPRRFVVVAIRDGRETALTGTGMPGSAPAPDPAGRAPGEGFGPDPVQSFHRMGCVADAAKIRERADGSYEVLATGTTRVRLLSVDAGGPFLTAEVEEVPEDPGTGEGDEAGAKRADDETRALAESVLRAFRSYRKRLAGADERSLTTGAELPDDPLVVSYLVAAATVLDVPVKQRLLQAPDAATRLREELALLRGETALIRHLPSLPAVDLTRSPTHPN